MASTFTTFSFHCVYIHCHPCFFQNSCRKRAIETVTRLEERKPNKILKASYIPPPSKSLDQKISLRKSQAKFPSLEKQLPTSRLRQQCCVLVAVVWKRWNNSQQHATTWNRVKKRDATCNTLKNVRSCFYLLASNVASVCTLHGAFEMTSNKFSAKTQTCQNPLQEKEHLWFDFSEQTLNIRFWGGRLREVRINTCVRLSETKRRAEARYIFKDIQFNDSRRLHALGLRSIDLSYNHIRIYRSSAVAK